MFRALRRFWDRGVSQKAAIIATACVLMVCTCCGGLVALVQLSGLGNLAAANTGPQPTSTAPARVSTGQPMIPTASATHSATPTPPIATATTVPTATSTVAAGNSPQLGGPYSDFVATYGQPFSYGGGGTENFYADSSQDTILNVAVSSGAVTDVTVLGPTSWTDQQTFDYCAQFLPSDATAYNSVGQYTDYHSSEGDLVLWNVGSGTCKDYFAQ